MGEIVRGANSGISVRWSAYPRVGVGACFRTDEAFNDPNRLAAGDGALLVPPPEADLHPRSAGKFDVQISDEVRRVFSDSGELPAPPSQVKTWRRQGRLDRMEADTWRRAIAVLNVGGSNDCADEQVGGSGDDKAICDR